jgi:catechol 2,3-dioxygenase-like lactoylglutathione lyase family enzyme
MATMTSITKRECDETGIVMFERNASRVGNRSLRAWQRGVVVGAAVVCVVLSIGVAAHGAAEFRGVQLNVSDPAAAAQWYCEHLGGTLVSPTAPIRGAASVERDWLRAVQFGKTTLEFHPTETKAPALGSVGSGIDHLCFGYADLDREMRRFATTGVEIVSGVEQEGPIRYAFIRDRWGTLIELVEDREIHGFHHVHLATTDPKATLKWYTEIFGNRVTRYAGALAGIRYGDVWVLGKTLKHPPAPTRGRVIDRIVWSADLESTANRLRSARRSNPRPDAAHSELARPVNRLIFTGPDGVELEVRSPAK